MSSLERWHKSSCGLVVDSTCIDTRGIFKNYMLKLFEFMQVSEHGRDGRTNANQTWPLLSMTSFLHLQHF